MHLAFTKEGEPPQALTWQEAKQKTLSEAREAVEEAKRYLKSCQADFQRASSYLRKLRRSLKLPVRVNLPQTTPPP